MLTNIFRKNSNSEPCDNHAVVDVLNTGRARDSILASCTRNVWILTAMFDVSLIVSRIQSAKNNVADLLSRWYHTLDNEVKLAQYV